eukprot:TRINITY_DN5261_c0_g1::TRINITY_DN5261_c0_g1_i1::g.23495::m.23495 TRINITY_DN5261_c0_g1::TRINITY_DN5261_c0_g1_i1::g.23495  ORF type:complete len:639 (-),score=60.29,sp/Q8YTC2/Y2800_NOSS1/41.51/1e-26,sp/Q8YTC2/Y2800_NOSS1/30.13/6e-26,sp/Q8YTC2/Y2800_NOSS1/30.96/4e-25,sp/Q8YTC2/Y2800_NOSS1/29.52/1e-22,sp/Q8YTC2/Y2800_NOSS1/31.00/2e-19,sp/Q8YTC2/Y2800_NOSS1/27.22/2e-19,sp/Q8YTC2/Y2800_NOSS1/32.47/1e-18,WD40/PF00400.27/3.7e+03,WD40/PF00400.27/7.1e-08,WD40/PF00400.27/4.6e-12,WD40/PF00400.27/0.0021,WD40/
MAPSGPSFNSNPIDKPLMTNTIAPPDADDTILPGGQEPGNLNDDNIDLMTWSTIGLPPSEHKSIGGESSTPHTPPTSTVAHTNSLAGSTKQHNAPLYPTLDLTADLPSPAIPIPTFPATAEHQQQEGEAQTNNGIDVNRVWTSGVCEKCMLEKRSTPSIVVEPATSFCNDCKMRFCERCAASFHTLAARAQHCVERFQGCQNCGKDLATSTCASCGGVNYCQRCSNFIHEKHPLHTVTNTALYAYSAASSVASSAGSVASTVAVTVASTVANTVASTVASGVVGTVAHTVTSTITSSLYDAYAYVAAAISPTSNQGNGAIATGPGHPYVGRFVTSCTLGPTRVWEPISSHERYQLVEALKVPCRQAFFSADNKSIVVVCGTGDENDVVRVFDLHTRTYIATTHSHRADFVRFTHRPFDMAPVSVYADGDLVIWKTFSQESHRLERGRHTDILTFASFSPDGNFLATASMDSTICIWDARRGFAYVGRLKGHERAVSSVNYSPDGKLIATASDDGTVKLWDSANLKCIATCHDSGVLYAEFSPDGKHIVTASSQYTSRVWSAEGQYHCVMLLSGHREIVTHACYSPDGSVIVTVSEDGDVRVWNAAQPYNIIAQVEAAGQEGQERNDVYHIAFAHRSCT